MRELPVAKARPMVLRLGLEAILPSDLIEEEVKVNHFLQTLSHV